MQTHTDPLVWSGPGQLPVFSRVVQGAAVSQALERNVQALALHGAGTMRQAPADRAAAARGGARPMAIEYVTCTFPQGGVSV